MKRYETVIRDGVLHVETDEGMVEIGTMGDIYELVGGETYTLEYDDRQQAVGWLDTDDEGQLSFDVREVLADMSFQREFVANIEATALDETDDEGYPLRTSVFADLMMRIWDSKGNLQGDA